MRLNRIGFVWVVGGGALAFFFFYFFVIGQRDGWLWCKVFEGRRQEECEFLRYIQGPCVGMLSLRGGIQPFLPL